MSRTLSSPIHDALVELLIAERKKAGLSQAVLGKKVKRHQPYVAHVESGNRRIDVVEFIELARAIGFDPARAIRALDKLPIR
jgi:transcriptional regulator with XRE-family HTH domain